MKNKKAFYFTFDASFAVVLILFAIIISSKLFIEEDTASPIDYMSKDIINCLANIKVNQINDTFIKSLISNGSILHENNSIIEQIGEFYVLNQTKLAQNISNILINNLIPEKFGIEILIDNETIFSNISDSLINEDLVSFRRLISGIEKFKPIRGSTSKVYLEGIEAKTFSKYIYYGGFIGQGNITTFIDNAPSGDNITNMYMELDAGENFDFYINNIQCNTTFYPTSNKLSGDGWNITDCKNSIIKNAKNNFTIVFNQDIEYAFVGGGFIKIDYITNELFVEKDEGISFEYLPEIDGLVNLYSSFYVPGDLNSMNIYLHYSAEFDNVTNNTLYLTIGNDTVLRKTNLSGEESIILEDINLTPYINYSTLSLNTIPIRLGYENVTFGFIYEGNADVIIVTDVSGSMDWEMGSGGSGTARNCDNSNFDLTTTSRLSVAKCLDKEFANNILNVTGNQVGLISYSTTTDTTDTILPTIDSNTIINTIGNASPETGYSGNGYTCICCGINSGVDSLIQNINRTEIISSGSDWLYTTNYFFSEPDNDKDNNTWFQPNYENESQWSSGGTAIIGSTNNYIYSPYVVTEIGNDLGGIQISYADLWEHISDNAGAPNDFSSGTLNYTSNTFGIGLGNDGWDWDLYDGVGPFGYDDDFDYNNVVSGMIEFDNNYGGSGNTCSGYDCSGAYGIQVEITSSLYNAISNGGTATISFDYQWDDRGGNVFESSDEVWIKAYWESPTTGIHYMGSELSSIDGDSTLEIDRSSNPDHDLSDTYTQDITSWIDGTGSYYLMLGGKLLASQNKEYGTFRFDNIQIEITEPDNSTLYGNFWEHVNDISGSPADFSSNILNSTGNTYGLSGNDDGWDWDSIDGTGQFEYDDNIDYNDVVNGRIEFDNNYGGSGNTCSGYDCSGAYGIEINITQEMYNVIQSEGGTSTLSFNYIWDDVSGNIFETNDQVWIKARWTSPTSGETYLGSNLDSTHDGKDSDYEIATSENPDTDISGTYSQDISSYIEGPGNYYLEIGGKLLASQNAEYGLWSFDDIQLKITNKTNHYYFRKHFTISDIEQIGKGVMNVLADDWAKIYLNGHLIKSSDSELAEYWNLRGINIDQDYFTDGDNTIAIELLNTDDAAKFDLELSILNTTKDLAMMVMSDGKANRECTEQNTGNALSDAIQAACDARDEYGITVYAVGYSDEADESTLQNIALCGDGLFTSSDNTTTLSEFYSDVASSIVTSARHSQTIEIQGNLSKSTLYGDSYFMINYTPSNQINQFGKISIINEVKGFDNCSFNVTIPNDIEIIDAKLTSYSAEHWTDSLTVNGNEVYNLSNYNQDYTPLGDPFIINIPVDNLNNGLNSFYLRTGDSLENFTGCSLNNTFIYTILLTASVSYSDVLEEAEGCLWDIEFEDGDSINLNVPPQYLGAKTCSYTNSTISYNPYDTYDDAMYNLLDNLDLDNDGRIYVNLKNNNFVIGTLSVGKIPYPWGPAIAEVRIWK